MWRQVCAPCVLVPVTEVPVRGGVCSGTVLSRSARADVLPVAVRAVSQLREGIDRVVVLSFHWSAFLHD